jgi:DNA-binding response OmpR family regulator
VEDERHLGDGLRFNFEAEGYQAEVVETGEEALEVLSARPAGFDVMVLDVTMPRMNGLDACRLLHRQYPALEILFVTQHDSPQMMREALEAGARGYVVKSNAARDLLAAVEAVSQHRVFTALHSRN